MANETLRKTGREEGEKEERNGRKAREGRLNLGNNFWLPPCWWRLLSVRSLNVLQPSISLFFFRIECHLSSCILNAWNKRTRLSTIGDRSSRVTAARA